MKTIKIICLLIFAALMFVACKHSPQKSRSADETTAAVFYTSDVAAQVAAAAEIGVRYANTTYYDIDGLDSAHLYTIVNALDTGEFHRIYVVCDTSKRTLAFVDNKLKGTLLQYELTDALHSGVYASITPMTSPLIVATAATKSKCEVAWEALYPSTTKPLICEYLGLNVFSTARGTANTAYTDSTLVDNTKTWTTDQYTGYYICIIAGVDVGDYKVIDSISATNKVWVASSLNGGPATSLYWNKRITSTSQYVIKKAAEAYELFNDKYSELYVLTYLSDLSDAAVLANWHKLLDMNYNINESTRKTVPQDIDYLNNTVLSGGKKILDYLKQQDDQ